MQPKINLVTLFLFTCFLSFAQKQLIKTLVHDNSDREYIYFAPENLKPDAPLVVVLHGFTSNAKKIMDYSKFNEIAKEHHFAVVYPQGTEDTNGNTFWNVGYTFHKDNTVDDVGYIETLVKTLQKKHNLSAANTFLTGMSNGGEMCYLLLCEKPELFNSVAPVAGMMLQRFFENCNASNTKPLFAVFGTEDDITNYNGDSENKDGWGAYISIPDTIDYWAQKTDYDTVKTDTLPNTTKTDKSFIVRKRFQNITTKKEVLFYKVVHGGHDWPGAWGNKDVFISREIWNFFKRFIKN